MRAVYLQVIDHGHYVALASAEHRSTVVLHASRGDIVDRRGHELAVSDQATTIGAYVPLADPAGDGEGDRDRARPRPRVGVREAREPGREGPHIDVVRQADSAAAKKLEAQKLPGLTFIPEERRVYPAGTGTAIVGTTDIDGNGLAGLEKSYDAQLRGKDGHEAFMQSGGLDQLTLSPIRLDAPRNGARLELSLDLEIQDAAERFAQKALQQTGAQTVTIVQIDPRTGGVLSMASAPGPLETPYGDATPDQVKLRAITDQYEPGSTFKPVTIAAGLDRQVISPRSKFVVPGCMNLYDRRICDAEPHGVVTMSVADILRVSSNVGTVQIAYQKLSGKGEAAHGKYFAPYINRFGFARPHRHRPARRAEGPGAAVLQVVRRHDREHPVRPGHRGDADPAGRVLRDAGRRRRLAPAAPRLARRRQAGRGGDAPRAAEAGHDAADEDARGRRPAGRHRRARRDPGLPRGRQDGHDAEGA